LKEESHPQRVYVVLEQLREDCVDDSSTLRNKTAHSTNPSNSVIGLTSSALRTEKALVGGKLSMGRPVDKIGEQHHLKEFPDTTTFLNPRLAQNAAPTHQMPMNKSPEDLEKIRQLLGEYERDILTENDTAPPHSGADHTLLAPNKNVRPNGRLYKNRLISGTNLERRS
jgi:hypothetical protein